MSAYHHKRKLFTDLTSRRLLLFGAATVAVILAFLFGRGLPLRMASHFLRWWRGTKTVSARLAEYGESVRTRMAPLFAAAGVDYPPTRLHLVAFKLEKRLDLYAAGTAQALQFVNSYPVLAASGVLGPKLRDGDRQVPEGPYDVEALNPNSLFHLALRLAYPSAFDREMARHDGRHALGGDIMIHGEASSVGCIAVGNQAIEDLFVLAATVGVHRVSVLIAPVDFSARDLPRDLPTQPPWIKNLYARLRQEVIALPAQPLTRAPKQTTP